MGDKTKLPYEINEKFYRRFEQKNNMIYRRMWDKTLPTFRQMFEKNIEKHISSGKEGYSRMDFALVAAGWTLYELFPFAFSWERKELIDVGYGINWMRSKHNIEDPRQFSQYIKKAVRFYGASGVGISSVDKKWVYKSGFVRPEHTSEAEAKADVREGRNLQTILETPIDLPEGVDKAIVMTVEMDQDAISTAPAQPSAAATALGYSKMAFLISCVGEFIRNLGYRAIQCGNDTALSIPLAVDSGLGALGRNGLLITPEFGPRVRICKIFTDMPLIADSSNIEFIERVRDTCKNCYKCAEACETEALSFEEEPNFNAINISNNGGVRKYYVDAEKCFEFWIENSSDCGNCIAVCPFSNIKEYKTPNEFWSLSD